MCISIWFTSRRTNSNPVIDIKYKRHVNINKHRLWPIRSDSRTRFVLVRTLQVGIPNELCWNRTEAFPLYFIKEPNRVEFAVRNKRIQPAPRASTVPLNNPVNFHLHRKKKNYYLFPAGQHGQKARLADARSELAGTKATD